MKEHQRKPLRIAYFDCQFGVAGDMLLGAMVDAGLDKQAWLREVANIALPEGSFEIAVNQVERCTLAAKKVDVLTAQENGRSGNAVVTAQARQMATTAGHAHTFNAHHSHGTHETEQSEVLERLEGLESTHHHDHGADVPATALADVQRIINASKISSSAREMALRIFARLGRSESRVHGMSSEAVYFHEVGAVDAIVDIVGFAIAYEMMGIERSYVSAVPLGSGHVQTASGLFPIPAPAVVNLLAEIKAPTINSDINYECVTPTGAAILAEICQTWGEMPTFEAMVGIGCGAGTKNPKKWPNICRVMIGNKSL